MDEYKARIAEMLAGAVGKSVPDIEALMEVPSNPEMGDFAFPCFTLSKEWKKAPNQIAVEISRKISEEALAQQIKAGPAGPYLNFFLPGESVCKQAIKQILSLKDKFGSKQEQ
ncbi:arginine--tRNA ligase, partial [Candidatus Woesearchaeota archaeon]|nr:arginine--tRNA ligase [Candidatus Woesearchaeota archaeon]